LGKSKGCFFNTPIFVTGFAPYEVRLEVERDLPIEVLIGGDRFWGRVKDASSILLSSSLVLLPTKFGLILTGNRTVITANQMTVNHITLEYLDDELRRF